MQKSSSSLIITPATVARWQLAGFLALFGSIFLLASSVPEQQWHALLNQMLNDQGWSESIILLGVYALAVIFMLPLSPFALAAGLFFGFWHGSVIALLAINVGALATFLMARCWLSRWLGLPLRYWQSKHSAVDATFSMLTSSNIKLISLLRLNPLVPFSLHNYLYGAAKTHLQPYLLGTFLGSAPFTLLLVYFGVTGRMVYSAGFSLDAWHYSMIGLGVFLSFVLLFLTKYAKSATRASE